MHRPAEIPGLLFAEQTNIPCPIPYEHMKADYFVISDHEARTSIKDNNTQFQWTVHLTTKNLIIDKSVIDQFLRNNKLQRYAVHSGVYYKYVCWYLSPWTNSEFFAGSRGR